MTEGSEPAGGRGKPHLALNSRELRRFTLFLCVGALNTLFGYCVFAMLTLCGLGHFAAVTGATALGVLFNFQSIGRIVFADRHGARLLAFFAIYMAQYLCNLAALAALTGIGMSTLFAEALILPALAIASFLALRRFVFVANGPIPGAT